MTVAMLIAAMFAPKAVAVEPVQATKTFSALSPDGWCDSDSGKVWYEKEGLSLSACQAQCEADPACIAIEIASFGSPPPNTTFRCEVWTNDLNAHAPSGWESRTGGCRASQPCKQPGVMTSSDISAKGCPSGADWCSADKSFYRCFRPLQEETTLTTTETTTTEEETTLTTTETTTTEPPVNEECGAQRSFDITVCNSDMCNGCSLAWCRKSCQQLQDQFPDCRCKDWPESQRAFSGGDFEGKGKYGDRGDYSKGDFGDA